MFAYSVEEREITHFHLFCGLGGGAKGFNMGRAELNGLRARFRCVGGVDVSPAAIRDFNTLAGVQGTVLDMFDREQYRAFHGVEPPPEWSEATAEDIRKAANNERPNIVFLSAPCKGFSGLLSESRSKTDKYQALNRLTLRGIFLMLEAFSDSLPEFVLFENVPRIVNRGRALLDQITNLLHHYGYAVTENFHDCGEIGGIHQSRKRFLLVARHVEKVPPFLYQPEKHNLRPVGELLERLPLPGDIVRGGAMHSLPNLQWKTWVRLAFVQAGSDWRSLKRLRVVDGKLADYLLVPELYNSAYGVTAWDEPAGSVTTKYQPSCGGFSVADPRGPYGPDTHKNVYRVVRWDEPSQTISSGHGPSSGGMSVADPRWTNSQGEHGTKYLVQSWGKPSRTITGSDRIGSGALCVADPRPEWNRHSNNLAVLDWASPSKTVIGGGKGVQGGWLSIADPRTGLNRERGDNYLTAGHYGVVGWNEPTGAVSAAAGHDNGRWNVADPRLPEANDKLSCILIAEDGTFHRPFTTLELAALQSLVDPDYLFDFDGESDSAKRERIGNAVPPLAAKAIADLMGQTLLMAWSGQTFSLSATSIWVRPLAIGLSVDVPTLQ